MKPSSERGFTLIEVLVAITVFSFGIVVMLQSIAGITTMLRDGRQRSRATAIATSRLERLRQQALATTPNCSALAGGSATSAGGFTEAWTVTGSGWTRSVTVSVGFTLGGRSSAQTVRTALLCQ